MNIIGTGLSGLVGSRIVALLSNHTFEDLSLESGVDITQFDEVEKRFAEFIKEIDQYLFPESKEILKQARDKGEEIILVSFGDIGWQKLKVDNLSIKEDFNDYRTRFLYY